MRSKPDRSWVHRVSHTYPLAFYPSTHSISAWCKQGIVGRGVLIDYLRYAETNNIPHELLESHEISLPELKKCAQAQGLEFQQGDILLVRGGWTKGYLALDDAGRLEWAQRSPARLGGVATTYEVAQWLWDTGFSAVASDATAFESLPFKPQGEPGGLEKISLHEILLGGWGMPIGESPSRREIYVVAC